MLVHTAPVHFDGDWAKLVRVYESVVPPLTKHVEGLKARWLVQDVDHPDHGLVIALFESLSHLEAYKAGPIPGQVGAGLAAGLGRPMSGEGAGRIANYQVRVTEEYEFVRHAREASP